MDKKLREQIADARFVSFDMFDTLVLRAVRQPKDLFRLIEEAARVRTGDNQLTFAGMRMLAERQARDEVHADGSSEDITLDAIYGKLAGLMELSPSRLEELKQLEIELETAFCLRNDYMYEVYHHCLASGKEVIIVSDMYLPVTVLERMLANNGFTGYRKLYLSADIGLTKETGRLFRHVREDLDCLAGEMLHIGDHPVSDVRRPREAGHPVSYYQKSLDYVMGSKAYLSAFRELLKAEEIRPEESIFLGLLVKKLYTDRMQSPEKSFWYLFGYEAIGILYYGFVRWLKQQAAADGVKRLYFLARDGHVMKRVYDMISEEQTEEAIPSAYLYASRRAFNFPAITELTDEALDFLISYSRNLSVAQYLERVGLNASDYRGAIAEQGFAGADVIVASGEDKERIRRLYKQIEPAILAAAALERTKLTRYLQQEDFLTAGKRGIVDIGWHGTMQQSLEQIVARLEADSGGSDGGLVGREAVEPDRRLDIGLDGRAAVGPADDGKAVDGKVDGGTGNELYGYYVGTFRKAEKIAQSGTELAGYLCDLGMPSEREGSILRCVELFEFLFTAPHGSVIGFTEQAGRMEPVLDRNDNDEEKLAAARLLQEGALDFVRDFHAIAKLLPFPLTISPAAAIQPLSRVLSHPTRLEAEKLGDITHAQGFGDVYVAETLAKPPSAVRSLGDLKKLQLRFRRSLWKPGFKRRVPDWQRPLLTLVETAMNVKNNRRLT
jgi:predicted HAD superfamily hydrolase